MDSVFFAMQANPWEMLAWMGMTVLGGFLVCSFGLQKGLERITRVMMLGLLALIAVLAVNSLTLDGAMEGVKFYPLPDLVRAQEAGLEIIDGKSMLACQQIAMMKFHFDCDLSAGMLPEIEEIVDVAVAMREARKRRLPHRLFVPPQKL